jgi:hypothetical protein
MEIDKAKEIVKNIDTDFTIKNRVLQGMTILANLAEEPGEPRFEHDQMWYTDFEETVAKMDEEAVTMLAYLGWFEDEEAWSHF